MNNKSRKDVMIHQLAKRAGQGNPYLIPPEFVVEFAEHIIAECIGVVDNAERGGDNEVWDNAVKFIRADMKDHFGVK